LKKPNFISSRFDSLNNYGFFSELQSNKPRSIAQQHILSDIVQHKIQIQVLIGEEEEEEEEEVSHTNCVTAFVSSTSDN
jgi:VIT1/CCC1 family predicted Fe2+/Mn2+ transporter